MNSTTLLVILAVVVVCAVAFLLFNPVPFRKVRRMFFPGMAGGLYR